MAAQQALIADPQPTLPFEEVLWEDPDYLSRQLITYIGNKRALLEPIQAALDDVCTRLGKDRLHILDAFSGSGVVSRMFKRYAHHLVANDIEDYARVIGTCYLTNRSDFPETDIRGIVDRLNREVSTRTDFPEGFIERLYAPRDDGCIVSGERVFYTRDNARRLDAYRLLIESEPVDVQPWLLGPMLSAASVHANTAGVFKGFYKDCVSGVGRFGGSGSDALSRILGRIDLQVPILSRYDCGSTVYQMDANELVSMAGEFDLAYFDPPYNQHPYGSNYFMLNLIVNYVAPSEISRVSGIPTDWRRSPYNSRSKSLTQMRSLISGVDTSFVLLSYNDEGFIPIEEMRRLLEGIGSVEELEIKYATFRGSRNLRNRSAHVTEHLFLVDKR
ncbi:MAG: DNA adenine methylase [Solirubrobacteraceae bacterium]